MGSNSLRQGEVRSYSVSRCTFAYGRLYDGNKLCGSTFCGGSITSLGDGGSPLSYREDGQVFLTGTTSGGMHNQAMQPDFFE